MYVLYALLIGLLIGLVARFLMPGPNPHGVIVTSLLGIVGSMLATFIGQGMNLYGPGEATGFVGSVIGAMLVLFLFHLVSRKRNV